jgi:hypothetical protein
MMQSAPFVDYPVLQVRPNTLLVYSRREWNPAVLEASRHKKALEAPAKKKRAPALPDLFQQPILPHYQLPIMTVSKKQQEDAYSLRDNFKGRKAYSGTITEHSRKRLRRAINLLIAQAQWKTATDYKTGKEYKFLINFITLTLPTPQGKRSDKEIKKKVLDPWLKKAKRRWKLASYVWRAERQGNSNIHFHIASDCFIPYNELRDTWNDNLEALGFISEYESKHKHRHPNSTDVHAVKNINNLAGYVLKYMSKEVATQSDLTIIRGAMFAHGTNARAKAAKLLAKIVNLSDVPLDGKVWDCSKNLKPKTNCELFLENDTEQIWIEERNRNPTRVTDGDRFSYITYKRSEFNRMLRGPIKEHWNNYLTVIRSKAKEPDNPKVKKKSAPVPDQECPF